MTRKNKVELSTIGIDALLKALQRAEALHRTDPAAASKSSVAETLIESVKAET